MRIMTQGEPRWFAERVSPNSGIRTVGRRDTGAAPRTSVDDTNTTLDVIPDCVLTFVG